MDARKSSARAHVSTREQRGLALAQERTAEIWRVDRWKWRVPSTTTETVYIVSLKPEFCPCTDYTRTGVTCKHMYAAWAVRAKYGTCEGCGRRYRRRDLVEVTEEHESLTWFEGDQLCADCARGSGIL
jgi:hypothetical protein